MGLLGSFLTECFFMGFLCANALFDVLWHWCCGIEVGDGCDTEGDDGGIIARQRRPRLLDDGGLTET